jgi:ADP-ribose pyrophosphatase
MSDKPRKWRRLSSKVAYENDFFRIIEDKVLVKPKNLVSFTYVSRLPGVIIAPLLDRNRIILVRQFRYIVGEDSWEFPAGGVNPTETPLSAARRELEEESGYAPGELILMNSLYTSNGTSDEVIHLYAAIGLSSAKQKLDSTESDMVSKVFSISESLEMAFNGTITCAGTCLTLLCLQHYLSTGRL